MRLKFKLKTPQLVALILFTPLLVALVTIVFVYVKNKISISANGPDSSCGVPLYKQTWYNDPVKDKYGLMVDDKTGVKSPATIATSGCGPTSAAMVLSYWTSQQITPETTAKYCLDNGYRRTDGGTYNFPGCLAALAKQYNLQILKQSASDAKRHLKWHSLSPSNYSLPIIMTIGDCQNQKYTKGSHYIVLTKIVGDTVYINDPHNNNTQDTVENIFNSCTLNGYWYIHK